MRIAALIAGAAALALSGFTTIDAGAGSLTKGGGKKGEQVVNPAGLAPPGLQGLGEDAPPPMWLDPRRPDLGPPGPPRGEHRGPAHRR